MAKMAMTTVFTTTEPEKETKLDKTARIVKRMSDEETEIREVKTKRLRKARHENKADKSVVATAIEQKTER